MSLSIIDSAKALNVLVKRIINGGRRVHVYASHGYDNDDDDDDDDDDGD